MMSGNPFVCTWLTTDLPRSDRVVLEANTDYWDRERGPWLEKVVYRNDIDHADALEKVCSTEGEIDIVSEVSPADAEKVEDSEYAHLVSVDALRVVSGLINRDAELMDDVNVRKALNLAADKTGLISEVFKGYAHPVAGMAPPYSGGAPDGVEPYPHDPGEAKRLLSEAGWPRDRALRLASTSDVTLVAEHLAGSFRDALGIEVEIMHIPDAELLSAQRMLVEKNLPLPFDVLVHAWFDLAAGYPPAVIHREYFHSLGAFRAGPPVQEFEDLLAASVNEKEAPKLTQLAKQIDKLVIDEALNVFLCCPQALVAVNNHVNFTGHAATLELAETDVDEAHWSRK
ncbi:ABC transporter substrate-binding protein [Rubrobacter aplysinae]|uniref:ABC transporter substrate-binding protein n=1 Tax=Rubrobacter aplysinae TaxID=909625 RepID=UPI00064C0601|nr:ABC transporter substrate-binding protein [Rubrobacter aplysinae]